MPARHAPRESSRASLCGAGGGDHELFVFFDLLQPSADVSRLVVDHGRLDTGSTAKKLNGYLGLLEINWAT